MIDEQGHPAGAVEVQGDAEVLSGKIQERYGRTRDEARKEVERFFDSI